MTMKDIVKECNCKFAKAENGDRDSVTYWVKCKLKSIPTDKEHCEKCKEKQK